MLGHGSLVDKINVLPFECQEKKRLVRSSVIFPVVLEAKLFQTVLLHF